MGNENYCMMNTCMAGKQFLKGEIRLEHGLCTRHYWRNIQKQSTGL